MQYLEMSWLWSQDDDDDDDDTDGKITLNYLI